MGRVLTNNISLSYCIETALGVAGTEWFLLEPNTIGSFGADISTVPRAPISRNRQRRKGLIVDLDSGLEFEEDLTRSSFRDFIEGFVFVTAINADVTNLNVTEVATTDDSYKVAALTADQAGKMEIDTLLWAAGFGEPGNNGLKVVDADIATAATEITVEENLVDEATPPTAARISIAGHRLDAAETVTWTWNAGTSRATLNASGIVAAVQALGLTQGQIVHIGSIITLGGDIQNAFENTSANDMYGFARVRSFSGADDVVFDKVDTRLQFTDDTDPTTDVDIVFGEFVRNVTTTSSEFIERSFQFEMEFPNLDDSGGSEFQYALGNICNTATFDLPLTNKATTSFSFVGTDTENPVVASSRKTGAANAEDPTGVQAFNTSSDIARLRITETDEDGLTTDFKSLTMTLNNGASGEKVLGRLGPKFINTGNFEVDIETQLVFTDGRVIDAIRNNETLTMDFVIGNEDGIIAVDIPSMTLGGGDREFPVNESVLINTTAQAFQDEAFGTSIGVSILPVPFSTN